MTMLEPQRGNIGEPHPSRWSTPYWEGCARGELLFQRCDDCAAITHTPALLCSSCTGRNLTWEQSAGTGAIYSWSTVWRPQTPEFVVPYVAVIVEMDEGWHILSNLIGCEHDVAKVGLRVTVEFHETAGGTALPYFRPT